MVPPTHALGRRDSTSESVPITSRQAAELQGESQLLALWQTPPPVPLSRTALPAPAPGRSRGRTNPIGPPVPRSPRQQTAAASAPVRRRPPRVQPAANPTPPLLEISIQITARRSSALLSRNWGKGHGDGGEYHLIAQTLELARHSFDALGQGSELLLDVRDVFSGGRRPAER